MKDTDSDTPLMTIRRWKPRPRTEIVLSFGMDPHYNIRLEINPDGMDSTAPDGADRSNVGMWFGGLTPPFDDSGKQEVTAFRPMNEEDLRWLAKACLQAAGVLRRLENDSRRRINSTANAR